MSHVPALRYSLKADSAERRNMLLLYPEKVTSFIRVANRKCHVGLLVQEGRETVEPSGPYKDF